LWLVGVCFFFAVRARGHHPSLARVGIGLPFGGVAFVKNDKAAKHAIVHLTSFQVNQWIARPMQNTALYARRVQCFCLADVPPHGQPQEAPKATNPTIETQQHIGARLRNSCTCTRL